VRLAFGFATRAAVIAAAISATVVAASVATAIVASVAAVASAVSATIEIATPSAIASAATEGALEARARIAPDARGIAWRVFLTRAGVRGARLTGQEDLVVVAQGRRHARMSSGGHGFGVVMLDVLAASREPLGLFVGRVSLGLG